MHLGPYMLPELANSPDFLRRFDQEARAISSLNHPHICSLFDVGHEGQTSYIVMEYLQGDTLAERLHLTSIPFPVVLTYALEIASALSEAHKRGIVHRDLKPGNIMITQWGTKLMDFGLAKNYQAQSDADASQLEHLRFSPQRLWQRRISRLLKSRFTVATDLTTQTLVKTDCGGTLPYMAPEQITGSPTDWRSDVFSFGAVLYEMATGHQAFSGRERNQIIRAILFDDPPPVSRYQSLATREFDQFVESCLSKDPISRCKEPNSLLAELKFVTTNVQKRALGL